MGRQPGKYDVWDLSEDDFLAEMSPVSTYQSSLFQRINRQRAAYFADVEDESQGDEDREEHVDEAILSAGSQPDNGVLLSGFADLSTWYCDALVLARSNRMTVAERPARETTLADQPTLVLALLAPVSAPGHIADMPTVPMLSAVSVGEGEGEGEGVVGDRLFSVEKKRRRGLLRFCWCLLRGWLRGMRRVIRLLQTRRPALQGHDLLMERIHEREKKGVISGVPLPPPDELRVRQFRQPADLQFR